MSNADSQRVKFVFCALAPIEMAFSLRILANPSDYPEVSAWAKRRYDALSTNLKREILYFNDHYQWYFITDLLVDLIAEEELCIDSISILIERLQDCDNARFLHSFLGLAAEGVDRRLLEPVTDDPGCISADLLEKATKFISKSDALYCLTHVAEIKARIISLCQQYWAESFHKDWQKLREYENEAVRLERIRYQHSEPLEYLRRLHPDLKLEDGVLKFDRTTDPFSIELKKVTTVVIKPSVFVEDKLNGNIVGGKVTVTFRLNFHTVMTATPAPLSLSLPIGILNDPSRAKIVKILWNYDATTKELAAILDLSPTTVSLHLKLMRDSNFVTTHKVGKYVYYQLRKDRFYGLEQRLMRYLTY